MNLKGNNLPKLIMAIGLIAVVIAYLLTSIIMKPAITEAEFDYSITYKLSGETVTLEDVYTCRFIGNGRDSDPRDRYYEGYFLNSKEIYHPGSPTIAQKDGLELRLVTIFTPDYLMGDGDEFYSNEVYLAAYDNMGVEYNDSETLEKFDAEIISYELPEPIENSFVFAGFSLLHDLSMAVMYGVSILMLIACVIFVKRDEDVKYNALDVVSIVFNFIMSIFVIPFTTIIVWWSQIFMSIYSLAYQVGLCTPIIGMFAIAASVCLRRKGFKKSGFFVQFASSVIYFLSLVIEAII